ncbi:hypothetical protein HII31_12956 [Pseudocercospora fuligena]|uniref:DUF6594 domain-containing protein n=1 Tax=Pseudocercospora fuligena TaxID=685502 RepID=A0A8H6VC16_9PEZI|nr:hypothetical protein HII31_12956 [Pseudocercospora fuligena]
MSFSSSDSSPSKIKTPPALDPECMKRYKQLSDDEKQNVAWQYHGYPSLSRWMASSNDFFVLRKFSTLSARSLLYLQNEIAQREKKLEGWDLVSMTGPLEDGNCDTGSFAFDESRERGQAMRELIPLLEQYYNLINSYSQVRARPTAKQHQRRNLKSWFSTFLNAIANDEQHFLEERHEADLFPINSKPKTPLMMLLEKARIIRFRFQLKKSRKDSVEASNIRYHSEKGLAIFASIVVVVTGLLLLFAPMWWLNFVDKDVYQLGIITTFVSVFAGWLWMAAGPRAFEILAGTAAYAAVLMVCQILPSFPAWAASQVSSYNRILFPIHWSLDWPIYANILTSIDYNHPRSKLYYDMHLLSLDNDLYDLTSTEIERRVEFRNMILRNQNLHSLAAKIYYHGVDNYHDMELIYDILTTCPNVRELDLTIADHGGCVVADYAYAFDFTENDLTFPPLETLKLKAHMNFGYDFDTFSNGQPVACAATRHGRYSVSWPWSWLPEPLIDTFYYRWDYSGDREGVWGWIPDSVVEFADKWIGGNETIDERFYAQDRLRRESLVKSFEEEHKVENLKTWIQKMNCSKLKTLHLSTVGGSVLEELSPALPSLVDLSIDRIDDSGLTTLPSFLESRPTPLQHFSLGELQSSNQTTNLNIITSVSTPHLKFLKIGLGANYTHGHQPPATIWNSTSLSNLALQAPNLTTLSIDIDRSNLTGTTSLPSQV